MAELGRLGRKPLPRDDRDFKMAAVLPVRSSATRKFWQRPLTLNQGDTGTCEGNGWTTWLADAPVQHPDIAALSDPVAGEVYARELYVEATGDTTLQEGAYTRQLVRALVRRGLVGAYHRADSVDEIGQALLTLGPVGFGCSWYASMDRPASENGNTYLRVDEASGVRGGHFFILDAVDLAPDLGLPYVRMHNSWGPEWAHDGTARIELIELAKLFVGDAWICTELAA